MNRDKQIEEMAKVIENGVNICAKKPCEDCDFCGADDCMCQNLVIAKELHTAGYRKASDVAREFRQRMNEKMGKHTHLLGKEYVQRIMREIEKEFSEGEG